MRFKILHPSSSSQHLSMSSPYRPLNRPSGPSSHSFHSQSPRVLISSPQIVSEASISKAITLQLQKCPSDVYIIISQPSVNALDFQDPFSAPHLRQRLSGDDTNIRSSLIVSEVVGRFDAANITRTLQDRCGARLLEIDGSSKSSMVACKRIRLTVFPSKLVPMNYQKKQRP